MSEEPEAKSDQVEAEAEKLFAQWEAEEADAERRYSHVTTLGEKTYLLSATNFTDERGFLNTPGLEKHLGGNRAESRKRLEALGIIVKTREGDWIQPAILRLARYEYERQDAPKGAVQPIVPPSVLKNLNETMERNRQERIERDTEIRIQTEARFAKRVRPVRLIVAITVTILLLVCIYFTPALWGKDIAAFWNESFNSQNFGGFIAGLLVMGAAWLFASFVRR